MHGCIPTYLGPHIYYVTIQAYIKCGFAGEPVPRRVYRSPVSRVNVSHVHEVRNLLFVLGFVSSEIVCDNMDSVCHWCGNFCTPVYAYLLHVCIVFVM